MKKKFRSICAMALVAALAFTTIPVSAVESKQSPTTEMETIPTTITQEKPESLPGTNIALNKVATSNLGIFGDRPISGITNGVRNQFNNTPEDPGSYTQLPGGASGDWVITVDLGSVRSVETVVYGKADLTAEGYQDAYKNNVKTYQFQVSKDGCVRQVKMLAKGPQKG